MAGEFFIFSSLSWPHFALLCLAHELNFHIIEADDEHGQSSGRACPGLVHEALKWETVKSALNDSC
jgi:hypothetical protein